MKNKIAFMLSAITFIALGTTDGTIALAMDMILITFVCIAIFFDEEECFGIQILKNKILLLGSLFCSGINGVIFYIRWHDVEETHKLFLKIGINVKLGMAVITFGGIILSVPFLMWFFKWMKKNGSRIRNTDSFINKLCIGCVFLGIAIQVFFCIGKGIWADEAFTLAMLRHDYQSMIDLTAADVHPPLYYILLKGWIDAWKLIISGSAITVLAKLFSVIPYILMIILSCKKIKKLWGQFVAYTWMLAILSVSYLISNGVEIRMYSWAMLFVTVAFISMYDIVQENKVSSWWVFVLTSLAAAYTHYFACVAVAVVYGLLLLWILCKQRKLLGRWFIASISTIIGYLPWLFVFIKQTQTVSESYWINRIGTRTIVSYLSYLFENNVLLICLVVVLSLVIVRKKICDISIYYSVTAIIVPIGVIFAGVIASALLRPVFVIRYVIPALACLWFGIMLLSNQMKLENLKRFYIYTLLGMFVCNTFIFVNEEIKELSETQKIYELIDDAGKAAYISDNFHVQIDIQAMTNAESLLWNRDYEKLDDRNSELLGNVFGRLGEIKFAEELHRLIAESDTVYFIVKEKETDIKEFAQTNKVSYEKIGSFFLEYDVDIYQLKL